MGRKRSTYPFAFSIHVCVAQTPQISENHMEAVELSFFILKAETDGSDLYENKCAARRDASRASELEPAGRPWWAITAWREACIPTGAVLGFIDLARFMADERPPM